MKTSIEKIRELSNDEFYALIKYLNQNELKELIITSAQNFPKSSKYYLSKEAKGAYWRLYKIYDLKGEKLFKAYESIIYLNKDVHIDPTFFIDYLDEASESSDEYKKITKILLIFKKLFDGIEIDESSIEDTFEETKPSDDEFNKKIEELEENAKRKEKELQDQIDELSKDNKRLAKELQDQKNKEKNQTIKEKAEIAFKVSNEGYNKGFSRVLDTKAFKSDQDIKVYLIELLKKNLEVVNNNDYTALSELVTYEYLLSKILED